MKNKSVPGYKRVFAWMIAVFAMVIPWIGVPQIASVLKNCSSRSKWKNVQKKILFVRSV